MKRLSTALAIVAFASPALAQPAGFSVETVVAGAGWTSESAPASIEFTPDGQKMFWTLENGQLRWASVASLPLPAGDPGNLFATIQVSSLGEAGLLGLAIDPDYATNGFVYAWRTLVSGGHEIVRLTDVGGVGTNLTTVLPALPGFGWHVGGKIRFGPDGFLYFVFGDNGPTPANAENLAITPGKTHRIQKSPPGNPAPGNPFGNSIWSYGLRNSYGMAFSPISTGILYITEAGGCTDEINRIVGGGWYGWRDNACPTNLPTSGVPPIPPILPVFAPTGGPTPVGLDFYFGSDWPASFVGDLFTIEYMTGAIRRVELRGATGTGNPDDELVPGSGSVFLAGTGTGFPGSGLGFEVRMGPDGLLYFSRESEIRRIVSTGVRPPIDLAVKGTPQVNRVFTLATNGGDPGWLHFLVIGLSTVAPTPTPFGTLAVFPHFVLPLGPFGAAGVRAFLVGLPNDPALVGGTFHCQSAEIDPTFTTGNASAAVTITVL